jgi:hypothetical protein
MRLSYNEMAKLSRHGRTHAITPRVCCRLALAHPPFVCPQAPNAAARPSAAGKGGFGVSPDYDDASCLLAEEAKRNG